jgi:hypothetical protein
VRLLLIAAVLCSASLFADESAPYQVVFATSCAAAVQDKFNHAVTLLHSFEYPETTRLFAEIAVEDPDCAIARWGSAMSLWHPLWAPPGTDELDQGARILALADDMQTTVRERAYLDAIKTYFSGSDSGTQAQRAKAYEQAMSQVYMENLDDPEAAVFYALALLATQDLRDKSYANSFKSAALLNWVRSSDPEHPGTMHYLIHSYDFPELAHLALDVAKSYARAAPDSAHAQHMPSHIFTRLGLWELSISSNQDSTRSAAEYTQSAHLSGHYDEGLHSMDYLMYAFLQTQRDEEAAGLLRELRSIEKTNVENFKVAYTFAASPARYALERHEWDEARELQLIRGNIDWEQFGWALSIHHFARGLGAARSRYAEMARKELASINALQEDLPVSTMTYWREQVQVQAGALAAWIAWADGDEILARDLAAEAAAREDAIDKHPVAPAEVLPARELYADLLFESGDYAAALAQYQIVLKQKPNRLNAMLGAADSAVRTGDGGLAARIRSQIAVQTRYGQPRRH